MKTRHLFPVIFSSMFCLTLKAQDKKSTPERRVKITDFSGFYAESKEPMQHGTLSDFKSLAPQCNLLNNDFSTFALWNNSKYTHVNSYSVFVGLAFYDKQKKSYRKNTLLRLGLKHSEGRDLSNNYMKYSSTDNHELDTIITEYYTMWNSSEKMELDASFIYKFIPDSRLSFYTGLSVNPGLRYNATTMVYHSRNIDYTGWSYQNTDDLYLFGSTATIGYAYKSKSSFLFSSYVPLGVDFRLGKKDAFLRLFHFFVEARPTVKITTMPALKPLTSAYVSYGCGVKISRE